jgi:hypothetical protein
MIARSLTFTALMTVASIGALAAQAPAPAAPPAPTSRGRTAQPAAPRAPAAPTTRPGQPVADADAPPPPPPAPPAPPPTPTPRRENQSTNVRIDVTITDQRPGAPPVTKTVSIVTGDGLNGSVRSQTTYQVQGSGPGTAPFNVDAWPVILLDGKVHVRLTVQYDVVPPAGPANDSVRLLGTSIRDSVALVLETGKPVVSIQSTDPVSDRKVSVEVKATILR